MNRFTFPLLDRLKMGSLALVMVFVFIASSCTNDDDVAPVSEPSASKDIPGVLESFGADEGSSDEARSRNRKPTFATLIVALAKTDLLKTVALEKLTVFAPTDEAFAKLGLNARNIGNVPNLRSILLYHVIKGRVFSKSLKTGYVPTLNGAAVKISLKGGVMVNNADVILADIRAINGVIHVIDEVLLPPSQNLVELAISLNPEFSILVQAVVKAGLAETLASGGPFTVFAPTNQAFLNLLSELGLSSLDDVPVDLLQEILLYHVVSGRVYSSDLKSGNVATVNGDSFYVNVSDLSIKDTQGRKSNLVPSLLDVQATNGVVHVIDKVILPNLGE